MSETDSEPVLDAAAAVAYDALPHAVVVVDTATLRLLIANRAAARELGYDANRLRGMTLSELHRPRDEQSLRTAVAMEPSGGERDWQLRGRTGEFHVRVRLRTVVFEGREAVLAAWRDQGAAPDTGREEIPDRSRELREADILLEEQAALLRTAERLLDLGTWSHDFDAALPEWSDRVREIYGLAADEPVPDFEEYLALVHPGDRRAARRKYIELRHSHAPSFAFQHRIVRPDGRTIHVKGVGERQSVNGRDRMLGFIQDITEYVSSQEQLTHATQLMRIAGEMTKIGGWRLDLATNHLEWTSETLAIHEEAPDFVPTVDRAIEYYAPEDREKIARRVEDCARNGVAYDDVFDVITAKGNRICVRAIGEPVRSERGNIVAVQGAIQDITDIVEAEQRQATISAQMQETVENMGDAFLLVDHGWTVTFMNKQAELLLERKREELVGRGIWDEVPAFIGSRLRKASEQVACDGTTLRFVESYPPLRRWLRVSIYPAPDGIALYFNDATEEHAREGQLRLLETAVSRLGDIVLITDAQPIDAPDGPRVVYVNDAFVRSTGYRKDEIIGKTPRILQGPETDRAELDRIRAALEDRRPVRAELTNYRKDGTPIQLEIDIVYLHDALDGPGHFVAVQRDVTERKQSEEAIRIRDERFRLISAATSDVIWDWDLATDTIWWSEGLTSAFGYEAERIEPGRDSWTRRIHPDDREEVAASLLDVIRSSGTNWSREYRFLTSDGEIRTVVDRGFVIRDEMGHGVRMVGSVLDVTEQRSLAAQFQQAQRLRAVGQLTGGIAHDFNNILTVILGNAEILGEELAEPEQRSLAEMTAVAAERGAELTQRLLAFARQQALEPKTVGINQRIGDMRSLLVRTLPENIEIETVLDPELWLTNVDPPQFDSAALNLVINARDAMPDGGKLTIETRNTFLDADYSSHYEEVSSGSYVLFSVSDTGSGMTPEVVVRAFEPFFTTKDVGAGSGLGLSMVYGFVKQSHGHITIHSEPGRGTIVKLYFPKSGPSAAEDAASPVQLAREQPLLPGGQENIFLVEDDDLVRHHLTTQLQGLGYSVVSARTGQEALEVLRERADFDMLLTDIIMPGGINGRELADRALSMHPGIRVLFTSGYSENVIVHHGRLDEGVHLLAKPYRLREFAEKVRLVLDEPQES